MLTIDIESRFTPDLLDRAVEHLQRAVALRPDHRRYRKVLAEALLAQRRFDEAVSILEPLLEDRHEPRLAYLMAYASFRLDDIPRADAVLNDAGDEDSLGFSRFHVLRGRILHAQGLYPEAANAFNRALVVDPQAVQPKWLLARSLVSHAETTDQDAAGIYRRALKVLTVYKPAEEDVDEWHYLLGRVYLALQYPVDALRHLEHTRHLAGREKELLLGIAHLLQGQTDTALALLREAADHDEIRPRCERFLAEIIATPPHARGALTGGDPAAEIDIDGAFILGVFGEDSPETRRLFGILDRPHDATIVRTCVEDIGTSGQRPGALFAETTALPSTGDPAPMHADRTETLEQAAFGRLKPPTLVDTGSAKAMTTIVGEAPAPDALTVHSSDHAAEAREALAEVDLDSRRRADGSAIDDTAALESPEESDLDEDPS